MVFNSHFRLPQPPLPLHYLAIFAQESRLKALIFQLFKNVSGTLFGSALRFSRPPYEALDICMASLSCFVSTFTPTAPCTISTILHVSSLSIEDCAVPPAVVPSPQERRGMKQSISTLQFLNRPIVRYLLVLFVFIFIASSLDMFWKKSSRRSGRVGIGANDERPSRRDRLVTAHFMVSR